MIPPIWRHIYIYIYIYILRIVLLRILTLLLLRFKCIDTLRYTSGAIQSYDTSCQHSHYQDVNEDIF